jgi:hypothetical protein
MPFPTVIERYGSLSATGLAKETTFGTPVAATTFLPMTSNTMELDPGWFSPHVMEAARDLQIYNLYGEYKFHGAIAGPLFPSNAIALLVASIGQDAAVGTGVFGTPTTPTSTTLNGSISAGATSFVVTSATGFATGQEVLIDTGQTLEVRKISNVVSTTITVADALFFAHTNGVTVSTATTTTLNGALTAPTTTVVVTSATGIVTNSIIQIDVNSVTGATTSEVRKVTNVASNTLTIDQAISYNHANGAQVILVTTPYTHTITQQNTLPSLTVEKNLGSFQSLQFAGCRVNKFDLKAPVGNNPVDITADMIGQSVATLGTPTAVTVTNESPFVFAEATMSAFGTARFDARNISMSIENGLKETYTYSGNHGPSYITPVTVHGMGTFDVVWSSLTDATYGDFTKLQNGTLGSLLFSVIHPSSAGTVTVFHPQIVISKFANDVKMEDIILSTMTYEATRPLTGNTQFTVQAFVANSVYLPY